MKIELKRIEFSEALSEETNAFSANLYINDKHAGFATNRGHGGPTDYHARDEKGNLLIKEAEAYCKALPPYTYTSEGETHSIDMDLEMYIDDLLAKHLREKYDQQFKRSLERAMVKSFVIGNPKATCDTITFKVPLTTIIAASNGTERMVNNIKKYVIPELTDGKMLMNTNIPESILKLAGLREDQYPSLKVVRVIKKRKMHPNKGKRL